MKPRCSSVLNILSSSLPTSQILHISVSLEHIRTFSALSTRKPKWNSQTNLVITNPTLLIMESCDSMLQLKQVHAHMIRTGLIFHLFPISRVLSFCAISDTGDLNYARLLFQQISEPNVFMWNTMIRGHCNGGFPVMGFSFFRQMIRENVEMNCRSFVFAVKACEIFKGFEIGCSVHSVIWKVGFELDLLVRNGLIHFYADCGFLKYARQVFDEMSDRDVVSWTTMIDGYVKNNAPDEALSLFDSMLSNNVAPNEITMITVLSACSHKRNLSLGESIRKYIEKKKLNFCLSIMNAMLDMYVKCGCLDTAKQIFDEMENRDVFSWTSMINGYSRNGDMEMAVKLFDEMPGKNVVSWNAMIAGYSQNNKSNEALKLFRDMEKAGFVPVESTLVCALSACAKSGCLDFGQWIHYYYVKRKRIRLSVILANAFIDMYAKCGQIDTAATMFDEMQERDVVSWNSMIGGFASHGHARKAVLYFEQMIISGYRPDDVTFVGVLSACNHAGLLALGRKYFDNMEKDFGLKPKLVHYACMIDLLGRIGLIKDAYELLGKMPMEPDKSIWGALLNACNMHGNVELGKIAAEKLFVLDPSDSGNYVLFSSLCANKKQWDEVKKIRNLMRDNGVKKNPGCSAIEVEGEVHEFLAADESHPQSNMIYEVLSSVLSASKMDESSLHGHILVEYNTTLSEKETNKIWRSMSSPSHQQDSPLTIRY